MYIIGIYYSAWNITSTAAAPADHPRPQSHYYHYHNIIFTYFFLNNINAVTTIAVYCINLFENKRITQCWKRPLSVLGTYV